jgi:hypothetical protein
MARHSKSLPKVVVRVVPGRPMLRVSVSGNTWRITMGQRQHDRLLEKAKANGKRTLERYLQGRIH